MKLLFLGLVCSACFLGASAQLRLLNLNAALYEGLREFTKESLIQILQNFGPNLKEQLIFNTGDAESRFPVIPFPNVTDPLPLKNASLTFTNGLLAGVLSYTGSTVEGISDISDNLTLTEGSIDVTYEIKVPALLISGAYEADLSVLTDVSTIVGAGDYKIDVQDGSFLFSLAISLADDRINVTDFDVQLGVGALNLFADNLLFSGVEATWDEISGELQQILEIYGPVLHSKVIAPVRLLINELLKTCSLSEFDIDCIGNQFPATSAVPIPTTPVVSGGPTGSEIPATSPSSGTPETTVPGDDNSSTTPETTEESQETTPNSAAILGVGLPFLFCVLSCRLF